VQAVLVVPSECVHELAGFLLIRAGQEFGVGELAL